MNSVIIIDDEKDQQDLLSNMLKKDFPSYNLLHQCTSVDEALTIIPKANPDLIFLDIMMPPKTGFDLLNELKEIKFEVIFSTSFEQFALQALKMSAVDYLLKPFGKDDLRNALNKYEKKKQTEIHNNHLDLLLQNINNNTSEKVRIALPTLNGFTFASIAEIIRCESDNMYTTFYFQNKSKLMVSRTMKECDELLSGYSFFRIHTSHLINLRYVQEYIRGEGGQVRMTDGSVVDVSRRRKDDFLKLLNKL